MNLDIKRPRALITGATSGIGLALAEVFAQNQYDLFLVARDGSRLLDVAQKLKKSFLVKVDILAQDLLLPQGAQKVFEALQKDSDRGAVVDVLVNNAGFGVHGAFQDTPFDKEADLVALQVTTTLHLTKLLLPAMIQEKRGHILNIASVYAGCPVPFQAVYGACKAFMLSFSDALRAEIKPYGVKVTVVCPGSTRTEFRSRMGVAEKSEKSGMSAEQVAQFAFKSMTQNKSLAVPGIVNKFFMTVIRWLPRTTAARLMIRINHARGVNRGVNSGGQAN